MTDIPSLVESVLRLDKEATKGPFTADFSEAISVRAPNGRVAIATNLTNSGRRDTNEVEANAKAFAEYRTAAPILATEVTRLQKELQKCNDLCSIEDGGGTVSQVLARKLEKLRAELETERRKVEAASKWLTQISKYTRESWSGREIPTEDAMDALEALAELEKLAALTPSEKGEL